MLGTKPEGFNLILLRKDLNNQGLQSTQHGSTALRTDISFNSISSSLLFQSCDKVLSSECRIPYFNLFQTPWSLFVILYHSSVNLLELLLLLWHPFSSAGRARESPTCCKFLLTVAGSSNPQFGTLPLDLVDWHKQVINR